ncbi:MAG TPA: glycosyltransferase family 87 protein [Hyphomicrobiaceae bacterium]|nr:glycosyltransferase family 87 protein [Hyphomicrobiaceae bacterium]
MSARQGARHAHINAARVTAGLCLFLLGVLLLNCLLGVTLPVPYNETVLHHTWDLLHGRSVDDSWGVMMSAIDYLKSPDADDVYSELFFNRGQRFQYPLSSLFALEGMLHVSGVDYVRTNKHIVYETLTINDVIGWLFIAVGFAATFGLLERSLKQRGMSGDTRVLLIVRAAAVLGLTLTFYPIVKAYTLGQIQVWINAIFALAILLWSRGQGALSGFLIGMVTLAKPHFGLFLVWGALRRAWSFAAAFAGTVAIGLAVSIAVYGLANHLDYINVLRVLSERGELYFPNQSINGVLNRLLSLSDPVTYNSVDFASRPPYSVWVWAGTLVASVCFLSFALFANRPAGQAGRTRDFALMGLCLTLASPVAWEHHYGITFPMFALMLGSGNLKHIGWVAASYLLIGTYLPVTNLLSATPFNLAQSTLLVGALILLVLLKWSWQPEMRLRVT